METSYGTQPINPMGVVEIVKMSYELDAATHWDAAMSPKNRL
jgi:hypothetical protein